MNILKPNIKGFTLVVSKKKKEEEEDCGCEMAKDGLDTDTLKDKDVSKVQETLEYLGYDVEVTGEFDDATKESMKECAEKHDLRLIDWVTLVDYKLVE